MLKSELGVKTSFTSRLRRYEFANLMIGRRRGSAGSPRLHDLRQTAVIALLFVLASRMWAIDEHLVLLIVLVLLLSSRLRRSVESLTKEHRISSVLFLVFFLWMFLSVLWSPGPAQTFMYALYSFLFFMVGLTSGSSGRFVTAPAGFILGGILIVGHISYISLTDPDRGIGLEGELLGLFTNASDVAHLTGLALVSALILAAALRRRAWIFVLGPIIVLLSWQLVTLSYLTTSVAIGASLYVAITITFIFKSSGKTRARRSWFIALVTVGAIVFAWVYRVEIQVALGKTPNFSGRLPVWAHYLDIISVHPVLGYGWGRTFHWGSSIDSIAQQHMEFFPAHNGFLDIAVSLGLVGAITLFIGLLALFGESLRTLVDPGIRIALVWVPAILTFLVVHDLAGTWIPRTIGLFVVGVLLGALAGTAAQKRERLA